MNKEQKLQMKEKKLVIDCVNKIKIEKYEEFEDSIFLEVYEKAARHTGRIIEEQTQTDTALLQLDTFLNQESYNNIIPFGRKKHGTF